MRSALGLMLASVVAAMVIAGVWSWTSSPRADAAPPQTTAAGKADPLPAATAKREGRQGRCRHDRRAVEARRCHPGGSSGRSPRTGADAGPGRGNARCANPDALGVSRTVVVDTTGGPGSAFCSTSNA